MIENWIETYSGKRFHFLDPQPEDILIDDIAYSLSNQCRYNGHCKPFYTVAEHSVLVSQLLPKEKALAGLLHDAAEAYLSDIPSPIKQFMPEYKVLERTVQDAINKKFNIDTEDEEIWHADKQQLCTEAHYLIPSQGKDWVYTKGLDHTKGLKPMGAPPVYAYVAFLRAFKEYTKPNLVLITTT